MKADANTSPEFHRFNALVTQVLSVPKAELQRRMDEYKRTSEAQAVRRGPKRKSGKPA